jgi:hypothetical protein
MDTTTLAGRSWSTAAFGDATESSWSQVAAMGEHLDLCKAMSGPLFSMHCSAEAVHAFAATRFVTTLVIVVLLLAAGSSIL